MKCIGTLGSATACKGLFGLSSTLVSTGACIQTPSQEIQLYCSVMKLKSGQARLQPQ
jgi:hypothetical protein